MSVAISWFRRDLRLADNPAWNDACSSAKTVVPLFIVEPTLFDGAGPFRRAALLAHLDALDQQLRARGGCLRVETGEPHEVILRVGAEVGAHSVHVNTDSTPYSVRRDDAARLALDTAGIRWRLWWGTMVHAPGTVLTAKGTVSLVFTPFLRRWFDAEWDQWPGSHEAVVSSVVGAGIPDGDRPAIDAPELGETAAARRLADFCNRVDHYPDLHDLLAQDGTSHLSVDLRWGSVSPRTVVSEVGIASEGRRAFVRQLAWRDWFAHLLASRPELRTTALKPDREIAWRHDPNGLAAWQNSSARLGRCTPSESSTARSTSSRLIRPIQATA